MVVRLPWLVALVVGLTGLSVGTASAEWVAALIPRCTGGSLAVDSVGTSHMVCGWSFNGEGDLDYVTYSKKGVHGPLIAWPLTHLAKQLLGISNPVIATDSKNRPHVALGVSATGSSRLEYLDFSGGGWHGQIVAPNGAAPQLTFDANDNPHIAYIASNGLLAHAYFDGSAWQIENSGVQVFPTAIQMAKDGTLHIAGLSTVTNQPSQVCEERGLNGSWTGECFDYTNANHLPSLAVGQDGEPRVIYGGAGSYSTIKVASFDGSKWTTQATFDGSAYGVTYIGTSALAIDAAGNAKMVFEDGGYTLDYVVEDGDSWTVTNLGPLLPIYNATLQLDSLGLPHTAFWLNYNWNFQIYYALLLPDLTDQWQSVVSKVVLGRTVITGKLLVSNIGTAATASGAVVNYYLSTDNQLDSSDTLLGTTKLSIGAGIHKVLSFKFTPTTTVSGDYLIASITPANPPDEANASNTVVAIAIP